MKTLLLKPGLRRHTPIARPPSATPINRLPTFLEVSRRLAVRPIRTPHSAFRSLLPGILLGLWLVLCWYLVTAYLTR